jgi:ubiquinone/menaquinone biosynthesis C-methylase UbiE
VEKIDINWDDDGVIPKKLTVDTQFVFQRMTEETIKMVDAKKGERILDVGCGRGHDLASMKEKGGILFGYDSSLVMLKKAKACFYENGLPLLLVGGSSENLPFYGDVFDKVYCKGAIDHFYDPFRAVQEMRRVLKGSGRIVISVANFESLGCIISRKIYRLRSIIFSKVPDGPHFWEPPKDHLFKFDRPFLKRVIPEELEIEMERATSLFWGVRVWSRFLEIIPHWFAKGLMVLLDGIAKLFPSIGDVIIIRLKKKNLGKRSRL